MTKQFQVAVTYEAHGYVTVTANNAKAARGKVHALAVQMDYGGCDANTDMMPGTPDLTITGEPVVVEPEDEEVTNLKPTPESDSTEFGGWTCGQPKMT